MTILQSEASEVGCISDRVGTAVSAGLVAVVTQINMHGL